MQHHLPAFVAIRWQGVLIALAAAGLLLMLTSAPASAMSATHARAGTAARSSMASMPCMSEMQAMMRSMHPAGHSMSMSAMRTMMARMHLPRHPTHAQCLRAMQTMMAQMHPTMSHAARQVPRIHVVQVIPPKPLQRGQPGYRIPVVSCAADD